MPHFMRKNIRLFSKCPLGAHDYCLVIFLFILQSPLLVVLSIEPLALPYISPCGQQTSRAMSFEPFSTHNPIRVRLSESFQVDSNVISEIRFANVLLSVDSTQSSAHLASKSDWIFYTPISTLRVPAFDLSTRGPPLLRLT